MIPSKRVKAMVGRARTDILPTLEGLPESGRRDMLDIDIGLMEKHGFMTLGDYLALEPNPYPYSKANPLFFSGITYKESFDFFSNGFRVVPNEMGGHYVGSESSLYDSSLANRTPRQRLPTDYERLFGLENGAFGTMMLSGGGWRLGKECEFAGYWDLVMQKEVPFFMEAVRVSRNPYSIIYVISGIDI